MYPASLAIVVNTFPLRERGKALAKFFGIAGGLTAVGPLVGGYLTEWTWRAIFWINIPVALIALYLIWKSKPVTEHRPAKMDYRGAVLIAAAAGPERVRVPAGQHLGLVQSGDRHLHRGRPASCSSSSTASRPRTESPLIKVSIFQIRAFLVENLVLGVSMLVFVPVFFFASEYAQISLGDSAQEAGLFLLYLFIGFVIAAQIGGRMLDRVGAKRPVVLGCAISAVGFGLWAGNVTDLQPRARRSGTSSSPASASA